MDGELQLALAFFAVLGGGLVAVLSAQLARRGARADAKQAFADARRLQARDRAIYDLALARALDFEMHTNATSANSRAEGGGMALLNRSAYEAARQLEFPVEVEAFTGLAYEEAEIYNACVLTWRSALLNRNLELTKALETVMRPAETRQAFEDAIAKFDANRVLDKLKAAVEA